MWGKWPQSEKCGTFTGGHDRPQKMTLVTHLLAARTAAKLEHADTKLTHDHDHLLAAMQNHIFIVQKNYII
jgi:hypothetical protein